MQAELPLKIMTVRKAVKKVYNEMPERFGVFNFCNLVRKRLQNNTMDDTIKRRVRELRASGDCPYKVVDRVNGIYKKVV